MNISLHYGAGQVVVAIPRKNIGEVIHPRELADSGFSNADLIEQAVQDAGTAFSEISKGRMVGVLLTDGTRDVLLDVILPQILPLLRYAHKVLFFICTGTHDAETPENRAILELIEAKTTAASIAGYEIISHDCRKADFVSAGTTRQGTEVLYNARLQEPDVFLAISDVKHHYFAGYSNPVKLFVPGLCAFETVEQNHGWTMDTRSCAGIHPWHPDVSLRDNPLAQDQLEAMETIVGSRNVWAVVTLSSGGRIQWVDFGLAGNVTGQAFLKADEWNSFHVEPVRYMVVSPGGLPNDVDLYIAQRALELTAEVVDDGGEILFLSACPKGVGSPQTTSQFYDKLIRPLDEIIAADRRDYRLFSHKPLRFAHLIQRLNRLWVHSEIDAAKVEKMHMAACRDPQAVLDGWIRQRPHAKILVVDGANKLLLRKTH